MIPPLTSSWRAAVRAVAGLCVVAACAVGASAARAQEAVEVKVERVRPQKPKIETLRFLKRNRDFIRGRYDLLRETPLGGRGQGGEIDPRFLAYQELLKGALASTDSANAAQAAMERRQLLESIMGLGDLEAQLTLLERQLADQRGRLATLETDFTGHQQTALVVVVSGYPQDLEMSDIAITLEDGGTLAVPLDPSQRETLRHGGMIQIFHGFVEPRQQVVEVGIGGAPWPSRDAGYVTLDPARDQITLLRLDLAHLDAARGAASIQASTWLHDARLPAGDG